MKKRAHYTVCIIVITLAFLFQGCWEARISRWVTLNRSDKSPYGYYVVYENLKAFFDNKAPVINTATLVDNTLFKDSTHRKLLVIPCTQFSPAYYDADELLNYINAGNNVLITSFVLSTDLMNLLDIQSGYINHASILYAGDGPDGMSVHFNRPDSAIQYKYPGKETGGYFATYNHSTTQAVTSDGNNNPNLIELHIGKGRLFVTLSPLTLSNYFLLSGNNDKYFEQLFSRAAINNTGAPIQSVIWDEYFMYDRQNRKTKADGNWFSGIMKNQSFRAGILLILLLLGLYTLLELRRRQKQIPVYTPPANDSLDFVKTMGLLYYDRSDHANLAQKMGTYFMEHVRNRYKLFSKEPNDEFIQELSNKSGASKELVHNIVAQINRVNITGVATEIELIILKQNIETFHNNV